MSSTRWFGQPWNGLICHPDYEIPVPVGEDCDFCGYQFDSDSSGVRLDSADQYHRLCLNRLILGPEVAEFVERCRSGEAGQEQQEAGHVGAEQSA